MDSEHQGPDLPMCLPVLPVVVFLNTGSFSIIPLIFRLRCGAQFTGGFATKTDKGPPIIWSLLMNMGTNKRKFWTTYNLVEQGACCDEIKHE